MKECPYCHQGIPDEAVFCPHCGAQQTMTQRKSQGAAPHNTQTQEQGYAQPQQGYAQPQRGYAQPQQGYARTQQGYAQPQQGYAWTQQGYAQPQGAGSVRSQFSQLVDRVNQMTGGCEHVELHLRDLYDKVFQNHTQEEAERIFIAGTADTTPDERLISSEWPHPWLYSRVFLVLAVTYLLLFFMVQNMHNPLVIPGVIFMGALVVPFSMVTFFFEVNAPRNISIFEVTRIFFIGGVMSLLMTMFIYEFVEIGQLTTVGAFMVGFVEELGKVLVIAYFLRKVKHSYILNGLLVGAAIGAGFDVFETAGYIFVTLLEDGTDVTDVIYLRGILALGSHSAWAGLEGAALAMVKGFRPLVADYLLSPKFLQFFLVAVVLHGIWDMPLASTFSLPVVQVLLTAVVWIFLLVMIHAGLRQISDLGNQRRGA